MAVPRQNGAAIDVFGSRGAPYFSSIPSAAM